MAKAARSAARTPAARTSQAAPQAAPEKIAKTQIAELVAQQTSLTRKQAGDAVGCVLDAVVAALKGGSSVGLPGLGTMSVTQTVARQGVRPGTNERITIPAGKKIRFKVAQTLKQSL